MATIHFYEKPGCVGNAQQKKLLRSLGHALEVYDLLSTPWTAESLRPFFGDKPVAAWFNTSAPKVKNGEINIHILNEAQALQMMLAEPLLISRPLMQVDEHQQSGFLTGAVFDALDIVLNPQNPAENLDGCPMGDDKPDENTPIVSTHASLCGVPT